MLPRELTDLHIHVGAAVAPHILWSIAHQQGFKLPVKDYWEFVQLISASPDKVRSLDEYLHILHTVTEKIQSSPAAIERSVYESVIGIDLAGSEEHAMELRPKDAEQYAGLYARAREAGLKTTVHTGETPGTGADGVRAVIELLRPHRIGHGVQAAWDDNVMKMLREQDITLEICPSSNLSTRAVSGWDEMKHVVRTFLDRKVKITINTDGPYLLDTDMKREIELLLQHGILDDAEVDQCLSWAREASFLEGGS